MLMILLSTLSVIRHMWQQLEFAFELEYDQRDTVDVDRKWPVDFKVGKTKPISFHQSNNTDATDVKMNGSVLERKSSFKILGLTSFSKLDWRSYIIPIVKTASKTMEP